MTKFSYTFKEPQAWPILGAKTYFQKILLYHPQHHMGPKHHAEF